MTIWDWRRISLGYLGKIERVKSEERRVKTLDLKTLALAWGPRF
jgi:hypothetical protein